MTRLHTHNRRRASGKRPICCPRHGKPFQGDGWASFGVARFRCPRTGCKQRRYLRVDL